VVRRRQARVPALDGLADETLLGRATRDPEAFAVFYRRHAESTLRFFVRRTACPETAADLTAETFAQAYLSRSRYRQTGAPAQAWLASIARHELSHFLRAAQVASRARRRLGMRPVPAGDEPYEHLMESIDASRDAATLHVAMNELTGGVAEAVHLRVIDGLPYAEVAVILGCTQAAARQRVARGLSHLCERLEPISTSPALEVE
jgi:RNA polymerase sigma-70 factor (ECF subfamily)